MKTFLSKCRIGKSGSLKKETVNTILVLLLGAALGIFAKWLDSAAVNDEIMWQHLLARIDLRNVLSRLGVWALFAVGIAVYSNRAARASINVFCFFVGMLIGYYSYTIIIAGFFPKSYMLSWGIITLFTPVLAFLAWYAKGTGWFAVSLSAIIIGFFFSQAFSFGMWYFSVSYFAELLCLVLAIFLLFKEKKQLLYTLLGAVIVAPFIKSLLPYIFGGL